MTEIETRISIGDADPHFYLCGRLIGMNKPVVTPILSSVLSGAWNLKEKLLVREEESGRFVFQFKSKAKRDRIAGGGPWSFNGGMLILAEYDGLSPVEDVSLNHLEVWISIAGLRFAMRNNMVLSHVVNGLGVFVRANPGLIQRKEKIQRVRVVLDVRNRILAERIFDYSPELAVKLEFKVERAHGICKDCGFFGRGGGICDKGLTEDVGPGFRPLKVGPAGTDLVLKKPKSSFHFDELVEVPVRFGSISRKQSPKKRGRPRGSRNKKRTANGVPGLSDSMGPSSEGDNAEIGLESEVGEEYRSWCI
ncbi:hypothetical protein ACLB2K_030052 [Fragaria x ananassa]